jgi:hypothetical protein
VVFVFIIADKSFFFFCIFFSFLLLYPYVFRSFPLRLHPKGDLSEDPLTLTLSRRERGFFTPAVFVKYTPGDSF